MDWNSKIENIIQNKKWIKNDTGLWKVQCCKLVRDKEELMVFIVTDELDGPAYARVEKMVITNNELVVFYDGEYGAPLEENEYENFSDLLTQREWRVLFSGNAVSELLDMDIVTEEEGFYIESHEGINRFINNFDEKASEEIAEHFNL
ncbi:MAG: hypothetical protein VB130_04135 [Clostridium sp.]|nr:hypothetical protein [Clostridium sp.]